MWEDNKDSKTKNYIANTIIVILFIIFIIVLIMGLIKDGTIPL